MRAAIDAWTRRERRAHEGRAWVVAHLMWVTGHLPRGTRLDALWRQLLGRDAAPAEPATLSPEASVAYMQAWLSGRTRR